MDSRPSSVQSELVRELTILSASFRKVAQGLWHLSRVLHPLRDDMDFSRLQPTKGEVGEQVSLPKDPFSSPLSEDHD